MNKNYASLLNAISALILTFSNGIFGIIVTRLIIYKYGSDFNGLNSTANQIINVLLIIEGGFTLASNVILFAPISNENFFLINKILSKTRLKFEFIGFLFLLFGIITTSIFTYFIKSNLSHGLVFSVVILAIIPAAFNLYYATTYRVLLQAQQKEYIINFFTALTVVVGHLGNIFLIYLNGSVWFVRVITMFVTIVNSLLIVFYVKKKNKFLRFYSDCNEIKIPGTKDVMIQKITGMIYYSAPIIFLSVVHSEGTVLASIYAVYNNVFNMIKSVLRAVIDAPRLGIGQLLVECDKESVWNVFSEYEYIVFCAICVMLSSSSILIIPFVNLYTLNISDANYNDPKIALLMTFISFFELIHIPSGHLMNMAGKFKEAKVIQVIACFLLFFSMLFMGMRWGIYGLLSSVLLTSVFLCLMELFYIHKFFFNNKLIYLLKLLFPILLLSVLIIYFENKINFNIDAILDFVIYGIVIFIVNFIIFIGFSFLTNKAMSVRVIKRCSSLIRKKIV